MIERGEHLRFAVCYWHTFKGTGGDPFGPGTMIREYDNSHDPMKVAEMTLQAAFEFFSKLGVEFWCFHDRDIAPEGKTLAEARAEQAAAEMQDKQLALAELDLKLAIIEEQRRAIAELSSPVLQLWDDVVVMPIIGSVDTRRGEEIMEKLLAEIGERGARYVILDITGAEAVDTRTADGFMKLARAV
ncbi:MAG: hypothetical protein HC927_13640, partial [Deltaproteobacteria bacterium]|nr:hypothetical protein [Deltaproteobacteria bacterium]